ncbi:helix-turn-helix transcriptional regulator [Tumebacillus sp. ITR2]|uniref:Helix-turn-helix transcriptional regulator n=1 Tax=Tumebacillus amylolyticus TaxID=2801339 RepID=A0ABS1JDD4_9BACL|nr:helix-turn-helix domain-containing protein [Tumebacillus amylolyticus]MBL0388009.1 helix-turn-helix transcriptional regulator [Tumebacillus amylolyticus]
MSELNPCCPIEVTLGVIGKKWTVLIIRELFDGKKRFSEIATSLPISSKLLTDRLKELEEHGIINRTIYPEIPPRVEYTLTESGLTLTSVLDALREWGSQHYANHLCHEDEEQPTTE